MGRVVYQVFVPYSEFREGLCTIGGENMMYLYDQGCDAHISVSCYHKYLRVCSK